MITQNKMRDDINPKIWGPIAWNFLDYVVAGYPSSASIKDQEWMIRFLNVLGDSLPCTKCRGNYKEFISLYPVGNHVQTRQGVIKWLVSYRKWSAARV